MMLAVAMIAFLVLGLWAHTGTMPPLVVVESSSMIHETNGEIGSIDAGDLILVMDTPYDNIVTFAEASDRDNKYHGYESHGMEGDVIIYQKNGDDDVLDREHRDHDQQQHNKSFAPQAPDPRQHGVVQLRDAIRDAPEADDAEQARRVAQFFIS